MPGLNRKAMLVTDALQGIAMIDPGSVDLVVTSPPYADARAGQYGGVDPDHYVDWFTPVAQQIHRVLKPQGTFILNIKERVVAGERHTYVIDLIKRMKEQGWLWTEDWMWHKATCTPGKWPNRFRDAWEHCLQFNKQKDFAMYQDAVRVPVGKWAKTRLRNLSDQDKRRETSKVGSGFGKRVANWVGRDTVYPTNVLHFSAETTNKGHPAAFPDELPAFFIKLFTAEGDLVLDPFCGSGTTCYVARNLHRRYIGIDLKAWWEEVR